VLPVNPAEVREMLAGLRAARLLQGFRGAPAADLDRLAEVIAAIGDAALALGDGLLTLEVNPLWVHGSEIEALAEAGSMLGSGAIIVADDTVSIPEMALRTARFYQHESCGKCSPCREGTNWTVKMLERVQTGEATPMDLDIMASVQEQIIGHCLCVLGDAMAMPIGSMIKHFREEFEAHIESAREAHGLGAAIPQVNRGRNAGPYSMLDPAGTDPTAALA
jgi:hypothetical protein